MVAGSKAITGDLCEYVGNKTVFSHKHIIGMLYKCCFAVILTRMMAWCV